MSKFNNTKLKIGDKVRILDPGTTRNLIPKFCTFMDCYIGDICTIKDLGKYESVSFYDVEENAYGYRREWLQKIEEN